MSRGSSLLEAQFANFSAHPDYGSAQKGVQLFDMDADQPISPESVGLAAELDSINDFMATRGAAPEHLKYTTIGLYSPGSSYATIPGTTSGRDGFVSSSHSITGNFGLRFPVIALRHDRSNPDVNRLNFNLRHEIYHLLGTANIAPYNNERLIARLRTISAVVGAVLTPSAVEMPDNSTMINALRAGLSPSEYVGAFAATSLAALAAIAMTYSLTYKPKQVMRAFSPDEYKANRFSRRNRHFQPFSQA